MHKSVLLPVLIFLVVTGICHGQDLIPDSTSDFVAPDTACQGYPISFYTTSPGNTFSWNFCTGNVVSEPELTDMGDPGSFLQTPYYINTVKDSNLFYSFVSSSQGGEVIRMFHGDKLHGYVLSATNLGTFGILDQDIRGISSGKDGHNWYAFVLNGPVMLRLDFGTSLMNDPVADTLMFPQFSRPEKILIVREGGEWIGFVTNLQPGKLFRLHFGNSLANTPVVEDLSSFISLYSPCGFDLKKQDGIWYMIVCNRYTSSLSRVKFGDNLLNDPVAEFLTAAHFLNFIIDISITLDCERTNAIVSNYVQSGVFLVSLQFPQGLGGQVTVKPVILDSLATLNLPYGLSGIFRVRDSLYLMAVNNGSSQLTRITFCSCKESSVATWIGKNPPPVTYDEPGIYNIILSIDEGTPNEQITCKSVVVMPDTGFTLGPDRYLCRGETIWLDPGPGFSSYLWSTGDTDRLLKVTDSGTYWVQVVNTWDCVGRDSVSVGMHESFKTIIDTTICGGLTYWAQGKWQSETGIYYDTVKSVYHCDSILQTNLIVEACALRLWIPTAFTPNGDGLNDVFHPVTQNLVEYRMLIYDRWGLHLFETISTDNSWDGTFHGKPCPADVYTYMVFFQTYDNIGQTEKRTGTFTLIR